MRYILHNLHYFIFTVHFLKLYTRTSNVLHFYITLTYFYNKKPLLH